MRCPRCVTGTLFPDDDETLACLQCAHRVSLRPVVLLDAPPPASGYGTNVVDRGSRRGAKQKALL